MVARRRALLIATDTYDDATFRRLRAPKNDADALAAVLADKAIGDYEVLPVLHNAQTHATTRAIEDALADAARDDLVLLYFSGHGVKSDAGELYLVSTNSVHNRLASTAISSLWIRRLMDESRCRRIMVWLDCCYAGAFPPGALHRAGEGVDALAQLGGHGSVVMTSSSSLEYAYETKETGSATVTGTAGPSVFTGILVAGLRTGDADSNGDGLIDFDELYDYVYTRMRDTTSRQTPTRQSRIEGKLYVANSVRGRISADKVDEPYLEAVSRLAESLRSGSPALGGRERALLSSLVAYGSAPVAEAASGVLDTTARPLAPPTPTVAAADPPMNTVRDSRLASIGRRLFGAAEPSYSDSDDQLEHAVRRLVQTVAQQWTAEARLRWGTKPEPLAVRWSTTGRPVAAPPTAVLGSVIPGRPLRMRLHGDFHEIADKFQQLPKRQLVILGAPASGKTALATQLLLGLVRRAQPGDPVPVLFPVSLWNPNEQPPYEWLAERLVQAYPMLANQTIFGPAVALRLLTEHRVIPILDGLDEMPSSWQQVALAALDETLGDQGPLVLTCRSQEYELAVSAGRRFLSHAAVVELERPAVVDIIGYLQADRPDDQRWHPVAEHLRLHPEGPVAGALSSPLMVDLATNVYADHDTNPAELLDGGTFADRAAIEQHLLDAFIVTSYRRPLRPVEPSGESSAEWPSRAQRWVTFLARHLERLGTRELEWWRIAKAVPRWVLSLIVLVIAAACGVVPLVIALVATDSATPGPLEAVGAVGLAVATLLGQRAARPAHDPPAGSTARLVVRGVLADLRVVLTVVSAVFLGLLAVTYIADRPVAIQFSFLLVGWFRLLPVGTNYLSLLILPADMALAVIVLPNLLAAWYGGLPRRGVPRVRRLIVSLGIGFVDGLVVTLPATIVGVVVQGLWLTVGLIVAALIGTTVGLGRWLAGPVDVRAVGSPDLLLRSDRRTLFISAAAAGVVAAAVGAGILLHAKAGWGGALSFGAVAGLAIVIAVFLGSGSAWLSYSVARSWLALRGRLPWRLTLFLRDAHQRGVLRQAGPAYQFSHALLQDRLANEPAYDDGLPAAQAARGKRSRLFRRRPIVALIVSLVALTCAVVFVYAGAPRPLRVIDTEGAWIMALSPGNHELATVADPTVGDVAIRNLDTGQVVHARYQINSDPDNPSVVDTLAFSADGGTLIAALSNGAIIQWQAASGTVTSVSRIGLPSSDIVEHTQFERNGGLLVVLVVGVPDDRPGLELWRVRSSGTPTMVGDDPSINGLDPPAVVEDIAGSTDGNAPIAAVSVNDNSGDENDDIQVWRIGAAQPIGTYDHSSVDSISSIALSPNGATLVDTNNGVVNSWDVRSGRPVSGPVSPIGTFDVVAFSPDGRMLAVSDGSQVELWPADFG